MKSVEDRVRAVHLEATMEIIEMELDANLEILRQDQMYIIKITILKTLGMVIQLFDDDKLRESKSADSSRKE